MNAKLILAAASPTINLRAVAPGASPFTIVIGSQDKYTYITDRNSTGGTGTINGVQDYNPNRVFTLTWKLEDQVNNRGKWYVNGQLLSPDLLPNNQVAIDALNLTAGQKYYWRGEYVGGQTGVRVNIQGGDFYIPQHQPLTDPTKTFSSVTVLTPDSNITAGDVTGVDKLLAIAKGIASNFDAEGKKDNGTILVYNHATNQWTMPFADYNFTATTGTNITPNGFGKSLILIDDWGSTSGAQSAGFAEASADKFFAALVSLNQSYSGDKKDALFNSSFHFIGHGRGAVVNSEVIQRLGTFYPHAQYAQMFPDLQMTTIDPDDFSQNGVNYFDPKIQVWNNVTFADNYYQTNSAIQHQGRKLENTIPDGWFSTPGAQISRADLNVNLNDNLNPRSGFNQEDLNNGKAPHNNSLAWYAGTADLSLNGLTSPFSTSILRRKSDFSQAVFNDAGSPYLPWYTNDFTQVDATSTNLTPVPIGDPKGQWEGVGTGWYYSVLGGGYSRWEQFPNNTPGTPLKLDNTAMSGQRGDFAVPTLFNGNFDVNTAWRKPTDPIPGWVFENNSNLGQNRLKLWSNSDVLPANSPDRTTYSTTIDNNYALELHNGDSLVHNPFVLTDWGSLRFNLLAPNLGNGTLNVQFQETGTNTWIPLAATQIQRSEDPLIDDGSGNLIANPARPNNVGYYDFNGVSYEDPYTHTISYGERGFETFVLDIPEYLRGKSVVLKFTSTSTSTIYLDDVFFKSQHLLLGNPTDARPDETANRNNYLIEKPQYSLSYNDDTKTPNWVSWQLDKSWLGNATRPGFAQAKIVNYPPSDFIPAFGGTLNNITIPSPESSFPNDRFDYPWVADQSLPSDWIKTQGADYRANNVITPNQLQKGHVVASADRTRTLKDTYSSFTTTNLLPMVGGVNQGVWSTLEDNSRTYVDNYNAQLFITAGGAVYDPNRVPTSNTLPGEIRNFVRTDANGRIILGTANSDPINGDPWVTNPKHIGIPEYLWKIILPLKPGEGISDITASTKVSAVIIPNKKYSTGTITLPNGKQLTITDPSDWTQYQVSVRDLEQITGYNFFSNLSQPLQDAIETVDDRRFNASAPLLAATTGEDNFLSIGENNLAPSSNSQRTRIVEQIRIDEASSSEINITHPAISPIRPIKDGVSKSTVFYTNLPHYGISETSPITVTALHPSSFSSQKCPIEIGSRKIAVDETSKAEIDFTQIRPTEVDSFQSKISKISFTKVGLTQVNVSKPIFIQGSIVDDTNQSNFTEVSLPSSITNQQLFNSHDLLHYDNTPLLTSIYSTAQAIWHTTTPINLNFNITNLPTGQLAEGTITSYNTNGTPKTATITIDNDANGVGWFIDTTPQDNSEFRRGDGGTGGLGDYYIADPNSQASGKYDLLTAILHEMGHTLGIINGYSEFDKHVRSQKSGVRSQESGTFVGDGFTAILTPDGSHLDSTLYPYDLMNTSLKPGVRKLPSAMDWAIINAINSGVGTGVSGVGTLNPAHLTAGALIGITNGDFTTPTTWNTLGATNIINGTATLTEQSQKLSELTQAFIIPTGAKTLQFTIKDNHLLESGVRSQESGVNNAPDDAFEVALLDSNTFNPLAGISQGLTHTDSLLNIQANGTIFHSDKVTITALGNNSSIVTIDVSDITPNTQATLYFNLLGFGARTSTVTIDDVKLFTDTQPIPVTTNDTLTTNQNTPFTLTTTQLTTNDTNVTEIQIINQPTHGILSTTPTGEYTYTPNPTYVGIDSFTYLGYSSDGQISNLATVNLTINNLPPTIETLTIPTKINEGQTIQLKATAKDGGSSENLTYTWDLGDNSQPVIGQNITHQFVDNGTYSVKLTVTDKDGGTTQQSTQIKVDNVAPTATITTPNTTINQGETINLGVNYSDAGIKDTHTITWNFDDGSAPVTLVGALGFVPQPNNLQSHVFTKAGTHNVTVTVTDNDGASTTKAIQVTVINVAPTITNVNIPTNINEGQSITLTATATDPGNDSLTYNCYINGATTPITGQTINYAFVDNGIYPVKLDVIDTDGAITTRSVNVTVNEAKIEQNSETESIN